MSSWPGFRKKALLLGVVSGMFCGSALAQSSADSNEREVEEVVVTGSYLRGSPLDAPSPVQVVDRTSMEAQGASQIWDVIKNLEINSGSITNERADGGNAALGTLSGTANVNLRNLGENSTLTLINGRRQVSAATTTPSGGEFVDINTIPLVMVERMEVLTDGGSALYGSDAVAGVVNIIMRTEFEGLELYADVQALEAELGKQDRTASAIWGWASDNNATHFVLAGEVFRRDPVPLSAARFFDGNAEFSSTVGGLGTLVASPALGSQLNEAYINYDVMAQAGAEGGNAENALYTDPLCFSQNSVDGRPFFVGTNTASRGQPSSTCREYSYQWDLLNVGMERDSIAAAFNHSFGESAEFYSFAQWSSSDIRRSDSGAYNARGPAFFLAAPGSHSNFIGQQLELGNMAAAAGLTPPTAGSLTNAPIDVRNGGPNVPMSANVVLGNAPRVGADNNINRTETLGVQAGLRGEFEAVGDRRWHYDVSYAWSGTSFELDYKTFQRDRAELAVNGLGGPSCTPNGVPDFNFTSVPGFWQTPTAGNFTQYFFPGFVHTTRESLSLALTSNNHGQDGCMFYNPFLTQMTNPELANQQELVDWMMPTVRRSDKRNKLGVLDAVVAGELFDMRGGTAQIAVGGQYRMQNNKSIAPYLNDPGLPNAILTWPSGGNPGTTHYVSNNYECSMCAFTYDYDRNVKALFTELSLPFFNNVESQIALRWEDYGGAIGSEVTPKVALSWRPIDELLLRGSWSQSFRAPNIGVQKEGLESSSTTFRDPIRSQAVRAGMVPATNEYAEPNSTYIVGAPAPDIGNESADTYGLGFIWTPGGRLEGFSFNADYWRFEVKDRVMPAPGISAVQHEIAAFEAAAQDPSNYVYNGTIATNLGAAYAGMDPFTSCDPVALEAQWGTDPENSRTPAGTVIPLSRLDCVVSPLTYQVDNVVRSLGSVNAALVTVYQNSINAGKIVADGVDVKLGYRWETGMGRFRVSSDFTYVNQYTLKNVPGLELGLRETGLFDAAGTTGDGSLVRSLPDLRGNVTLNWTTHDLRHSVTGITRVIGSYENLAYQDTYDNGNDWVRSVVNRKISSYSSVDLQYSYTHEWANSNLGTSVFTLGILDAFNASLPFHYSGALRYDATVFDGRGRRLYARALLQL